MRPHLHTKPFMLEPLMHNFFWLSVSFMRALAPADVLAAQVQGRRVCGHTCPHSALRRSRRRASLASRTRTWSTAAATGATSATRRSPRSPSCWQRQVTDFPFAQRCMPESVSGLAS